MAVCLALAGLLAAPARAGTYQILHAFQGGSVEGQSPQSILLASGGLLYGTTTLGGPGGANAGTVFSMTPAGAMRLLGGFANAIPPAGQGNAYPGTGNPVTGLTQIGGVLYGTTPYDVVFRTPLQGGPYLASQSGYYALTPGAPISVLGIPPGGEPNTLAAAGGLLYGSSAPGDILGFFPALYGGTLYTIGADGTLGQTIDIVNVPALAGPKPFAKPYVTPSLLAVGATVYGTGGIGNGAIFRWLPGGGVQVIYRFPGGKGAAVPAGPLLYATNIFYGVSSAGGTAGAGTVFAVNRLGHAVVLHSFGGPGDGTMPVGGLAILNSTLYGVTQAGGANGGGTLYSIAPDGTYTVLHALTVSQNLGANIDGFTPTAGLTQMGGVIYGTTSLGGAAGAGTVFQYTP